MGIETFKKEPTFSQQKLHSQIGLIGGCRGRPIYEDTIKQEDRFKLEINYPNQFPFKKPPFFSRVEFNNDQKIDGLGQVSFSMNCSKGCSPAKAASQIIDYLVTSLNSDDEDEDEFYDCYQDQDLFVINEQSFLRKCFRNLDDYIVQYVFEKC